VAYLLEHTWDVELNLGEYVSALAVLEKDTGYGE